MKYGIPTSKGAGIFYFERERMAQRLILIRHGDLGESCRGCYISRTDVPLSAEGRRQAAALAGELGPLNGAHILCSPLLRYRETAGTVVAITHGGAIRLFICRFLGLDYRQYLLFDVRPASISEIRIEDGRGVLTRVNDTHHLEG